MGERAGELDYGANPVLDPQDDMDNMGDMDDIADDADLAAGANPPANYYAGGAAGAEAYYATQSPQSDLPSNAKNANSTNTTSTDENADPSQIRDNIEQTRQQMSHTIDAIQEKLSPSHLMHEAQHAVRDATIGRAEEVMNDVTDTVQGAGSSLLDTIRENPIPAALAAVGLGWLIYKAVNNSSQANNYNYSNDYGARRSAQGYGPYYQGRYGQTGYGNYDTDYNNDNTSAKNPLGQATNAVRGAAGNVTDKAQDVAGNVASTVQDAAGTVADTAQQLASQAQDQAQQIGYQAEYGMVRARNWLEQTWESNPLALGAAALAAGAIIGGLIPETPMEDRLMGEQRDAVLQKAEGVAQDTVQKVEGAAQQALGTVQQNVKQSQQQTSQAQSSSQAKPQTANGYTGTSSSVQSKGSSPTSPSTQSSTKSGASSADGSATGNTTSSSTSSQTPPPSTSGTSTHGQPSAH